MTATGPGGTVGLGADGSWHTTYSTGNTSGDQNSGNSIPQAQVSQSGNSWGAVAPACSTSGANQAAVAWSAPGCSGGVNVYVGGTSQHYASCSGQDTLPMAPGNSSWSMSAQLPAYSCHYALGGDTAPPYYALLPGNVAYANGKSNGSQDQPTKKWTCGYFSTSLQTFASGSATSVACFPPPTATLNANPTALQLGQPTTLAWSSTNADSCTGTGFSTGGATSGSVQASPDTGTTYSVSCTGKGGTASDSASVTVVGPTATLNCSPNPIEQGASCTMTWSSTNAVSCTGSGFATGNAKSGSTSVSPWTTSSYAVTCTNAYGRSANANETVTVLVPTISASANPPRVVTGQSSTVTWSAENVRDCKMTNTETGNVVDQKSRATTGSLTDAYDTGALGHDASFLLSCKNSVNTLATSTLVVPVAPSFGEF